MPLPHNGHKTYDNLVDAEYERFRYERCPECGKLYCDRFHPTRGSCCAECYTRFCELARVAELTEINPIKGDILK
jgi:hypothetical protein